VGKNRQRSGSAGAFLRKGLIMRKSTSVMAASVLLAAGAVSTAPPAAAAQGSLSGEWASIDLDGSNQTLRITGTGSPTYAMLLEDDATSEVCGGAPAALVGTGRLDGDELLMRGIIVCLPGGNALPGEHLDFSFEYDAAADTLTDFTGVVWHRVD
jgi:hypothetical protein